MPVKATSKNIIQLNQANEVIRKSKQVYKNTKLILKFVLKFVLKFNYNVTIQEG